MGSVVRGETNLLDCPAFTIRQVFRRQPRKELAYRFDRIFMLQVLDVGTGAGRICSDLIVQSYGKINKMTLNRRKIVHQLWTSLHSRSPNFASRIGLSDCAVLSTVQGKPVPSVSSIATQSKPGSQWVIYGVSPTKVRKVLQDSCQLPGRKGFSAIPELPRRDLV